MTQVLGQLEGHVSLTVQPSLPKLWLQVTVSTALIMANPACPVTGAWLVSILYCPLVCPTSQGPDRGQSVMSQAPLHKQESRDKEQPQVSGDLEAFWKN